MFANQPALSTGARQSRVTLIITRFMRLISLHIRIQQQGIRPIATPVRLRFQQDFESSSFVFQLGRSRPTHLIYHALHLCRRCTSVRRVSAAGITGPMCVCSAAENNVYTEALMRFKNNGDYLHYSSLVWPEYKRLLYTYAHLPYRVPDCFSFSMRAAATPQLCALRVGLSAASSPFIRTQPPPAVSRCFWSSATAIILPSSQDGTPRHHSRCTSDLAPCHAANNAQRTTKLLQLENKAYSLLGKSSVCHCNLGDTLLPIPFPQQSCEPALLHRSCLPVFHSFLFLVL